jgi:glucose-1-phosphate thymidylyltransferase
MKGIILACATGSRLFLVTKVTNKHLLPVGREPMIFHPVNKMTDAGIDEILVVTGVEHMGDVVNVLGSGREFRCRFTYKVRDEAGGIAPCSREPDPLRLGAQGRVAHSTTSFHSGPRTFSAMD